jgi:hypothetical protein
MPRRRELKGICLNFSELLNCRNNDYLGYWAVGQLCLLAKNEGVNSISLNLVNSSNSLSNPEVELMNKQMKGYLDKILNAHKIPHNWIKSVLVKFSFNQEYQHKFHYWGSAIGNHYLLQLTIETDLGYINSAIQGGNVKPHDPSKEQGRNDF